MHNYHWLFYDDVALQRQNRERAQLRPFSLIVTMIETFFVYNIPNEKKLYSELDGYSTGVDLDTDVIHRSNIPSDITSRYAEKRLDCLEKMNMV